MKQRTRCISAILCAALLLTLAACKKPEEAPTITPEEQALLDYQKACENVGKAPDLTIQVEYALSRTVGGEVYSESRQETAVYRGLNTDTVAAVVKQQVSFGPFETQYAEYYHNGLAYCRADDCTFSSEMDSKQFLKRQIPAILLDTALYETWEVDKLFGNTGITFSEPKELEAWATDYGDAVLVSASGTAVLDKDGNLIKSTYNAQFTCAGVSYDLQVTASISPVAAQTLDDDLAALPDKCPKLNYLGAPRKILQVVGDVYTAQSMSAEYSESVYSEAFARSRSQTSSFDTYGTGTDFMAQSSYKVTNTDYSNTPVTSAETVVFRDSVCASILNGSEPIAREGITAEKMRTACEDAILAALFTPNHLQNATMVEKKGQLQIEFTGNTAFADYVCSNIYSIFNANLDTYAQSYTTPTAGGYLYIDKATGLPTALGIKLERIHVAGEVAYPLTYQLDQTMQLSSEEAYDNIAGIHVAPETTPTEPATQP